MITKIDSEYTKTLGAACSLCSKSEKCVIDIRQYLFRKGVADNIIEQIITYLTENQFINHSRYAKAYVNDKIKFAGWGLIKIGQMLKLKQIEPEIIKEALDSADIQFEESNALKLLTYKYKTIKEDDINKIKAKLIRFAFSRGWNSRTSMQIINNLLYSQKDN